MKCYKYWRMFRCEGCMRMEYHRVANLWSTYWEVGRHTGEFR